MGDIELGFMGLSQPHSQLLAASLGALDAAIEAMPLRVGRRHDDPARATATASSAAALDAATPNTNPSSGTQNTN